MPYRIKPRYTVPTFRLPKYLLYISMLCLPLIARGQAMTDSSLQQLIIKAQDNIYNYNFPEAENHIRQIRARYPQNPVGPILKAVSLQWQYIPMKDNRNAVAQYVQACEQTIELAKLRLNRNEHDPESVFFALAAHGYLAMKHNYDKEMMKAVGESRKAYAYMKEGFDLMEKNPEFYFTTGLYNYYVERYPDDHPAVKPMMIFFKDGDMATGLRQMETAARRGLFTKTEASYYVAYISLKHENRFDKAAVFLKTLIDKYPNNPVFTMKYAEALLLAGRYDDAKPFVQRLKQLDKPFLQVAIRMFDGMLQEKDERNDKAAATSYQTAIKQPLVEGYTNEYRSFAYAGLARLAARSGNREQAKSYYKKVLDITEYKSLIREAKNFMKS